MLHLQLPLHWTHSVILSCNCQNPSKGLLYKCYYGLSVSEWSIALRAVSERCYEGRHNGLDCYSRSTTGGLFCSARTMQVAMHLDDSDTGSGYVCYSSAVFDRQEEPSIRDICLAFTTALSS
jgi:hypothetical protein